MAAAVMSLGAMAQQALWGAPQIVSPEVNPDKTVTFRLVAPNASEVKVTGDFLPTEKIKTPFGEFDVPARPLSPKTTKACGNSRPTCSLPSFTATRL